MPKKTSNLNLSESQGKESNKNLPSIKKKNVITKNNINTKSSTKSITKNISSRTFGKSTDLGDVLARCLLGNSSFQVKKSKILSDYDLTGLEKKENVRSSPINKSKTKVLYNNEKNYHKFEQKFDPKINSKFDPKINSKFDPKINSKFDPKINSKFNPKIKQKFKEQMEPVFNYNFDPKFNTKFDVKYKSDDYNKGKTLKPKKSNLESKRINEMSKSIQKLDRIVAGFKNDISTALTKKIILGRNSSLSTLEESSNSDVNPSINTIRRSDKKLSNMSIINLPKKNDKKLPKTPKTLSANKKSSASLKNTIPSKQSTTKLKSKGSFTLKSLIPLYKNEPSDTKKVLKGSNVVHQIESKEENYNEFLDHLIQSRRLYLSEFFSEKKEIKEKKSNHTKFKKTDVEIDLNEDNKKKTLKSSVKKVKSSCTNTDLVGDVLLKFHEKEKKEEEEKEESVREIVDKDREILYKTNMFDKIVEVFDKRLPILDKKEENVNDKEALKMELFGEQNEVFDEKQLNLGFNNNDNKNNEDLDKKQESFYENPDVFDKQQQIYDKCNEIFENKPDNLDKKEIFNKLQQLFNQGHAVFDRIINKPENQLKIDIFVDKQEIFGDNTEIFTKLQEAFDKEILENNQKSENINEVVEVFDKEQRVFNKMDIIKGDNNTNQKNKNEIVVYHNHKLLSTASKADFSDKDTEIMDKAQILNKMQQVFNKNQQILDKNREILHKNQKETDKSSNKKKKIQKPTKDLLFLDQLTQTDPVPLDLISKKLPIEELLKPTKPITPSEDIRFSDPIQHKSQQYDIAIQQGIDLTKRSITEFFGLIQSINEMAGDNKIDLYEDTCGLKYAKNPNKNLENAKNGKLDKILFKNFEKVEYYLRMVMYYYKLMIYAKSSVDKVIKKRFV
nr:protein PFC0760c-like isoform X1 [Onthophagus taurus]